MRLIDLTGRRYGRLIVIERVTNDGRSVRWLCRCDCGNEREVRGASLTTGNTSSCGCLHRELQSSVPLKHGAAKRGRKTRTYVCWKGMRRRCYDPKNKRYKDYGGRGIRVCARWSDFANFLSDMGEKPYGLTLERVDNDGDYEPGNCVWDTWMQQRYNQRRMRVEQVQLHWKYQPQWPHALQRWLSSGDVASQ